jgi:hypothetical protein
MSVVFNIQGREAIPVRSVLMVTHGYVTPLGLAVALSVPDGQRELTAHRYLNGKVEQVGHEGWGMKSDELDDISRAFKRDEQEPDQHRQLAWRKSIEALPSGVFIWLDEFQKWYVEHVFAQDTTWEAQHLVFGEDDDPEPLFIPTRAARLDLCAIALSDMLPMIQEGFEMVALPDPVTPAHATEDWRNIVRAEAWEEWVRTLAKNGTPTLENVSVYLAKWCKANGVNTGTTNKHPSASYLKVHIISGKHWSPPRNMSRETAKKHLEQKKQEI